MRTFKILLALAVAAGTFYSLNVLATQYGYRDRLDFKNRHYHGGCDHGQYSNHGFSHHRTPVSDTIIPPDSINKVSR
ncbi:hypothetical protein [uncultured Pedobacter sp.]|uniref:hypothetical protein n=1 Tax=uncultured Pedobacter sp. TaxID=246139 RepID=UPI0025CE4B75|nr:hypothetical protein [uncultured Pedobacter sp.]